ncbi:flavin-containing monooxygenase 1-like isoform X2 [Apostichopus japonicus]|uniref:flavin-containing monooxygenase 1-like isoform X2 n=1 Tax=Stichopus japonicus TaxID=307972 RepID=UPI003AB1B802
MKGNRIGIIGAGPSGLAAIKACLEEGFKPVAFERTDQLGGTWVYREDSKTDYPEAGAVYNCLKTNTSKAFFGFTDFPCPKEWSPFVTHRKCLEYFQEYAKHFDLSQYIRFNAEVLKVYPTDDHETTGRWRLRYQSGREYCEEIFDAVMICTGVFARANLPRYPGQDCFKGDISTGSKYRENTKYSDKNVLVVGGGISAGDIATDISNISKQTYISSRNGFYCKPVIDSNGWPFDVFLGTRLIQLLPNWIKTWLSERQSYKRFRCEELGLIIPSKDGPNPTGAILNDNFINQVLCGKILPKPSIRRFTDTGVVFNDGSKLEDLDAVMFCTGYHSQVPFLDEASGTPSQRDIYSLIFPVHLKHSTLALIGFFKNTEVGSPVTASEMQIRWVAQVWSGNCLLPSTSEMIASVAKRRNKERSIYGRVVCRIDALRYTDYIATKLGCYPSLASLLVSDPRLAIHMLFSPVVPATYRLVGPHCWKGARDVILNSWGTTFQGTRTKEVNRTVSEFSKMKVCVILLTMVIMVLSYAIVG